MDQALLFRSLGEVASRINASGDLEATLKHLLDALCHRSPWDAGAIMSVELERRFARVIARHDPNRLGPSLDDQWNLSESPSTLALTTNNPVIIPDAQICDTFPGYRREAIEHDYRTVVVLPMEYQSVEGHRTVLSVRSRDAVDVSDDEIAFLQFLVHLGTIAMRKARALAEEQAFGERLRSILAAHASLLERVLADGSVAVAAAMVASVLPNPLVVIDLTARKVLADRSPDPGAIDDKSWAAAMRDAVGSQFLDLAFQAARRTGPETRDLVFHVNDVSLKIPALVSPLVVDGEAVGALVVFSRATDFGDLDHLLLDSARFALSVQMMREHVRFAADARNLEDVFRNLFKEDGHVLAETAERALRHGIDLRAPARLIVLSLSGELGLVGAPALEAHRAIVELARRYDDKASAIILDGSIVVHCAVQPKTDARSQSFIRRLVDEVRRATGEAAIAVQGKRCREPADYHIAWRECGRLLDLARRFGRRGIVTARDFGPFPLLVSALDTIEMRGFVEDLIGAVVTYDRLHGTAYIPTLAIFLDHGCRSQACANAMGLHVTTLRYRLARLRELFDVRTDTPERRFALQLALHLQNVMTPGAMPTGSTGAEQARTSQPS